MLINIGRGLTIEVDASKFNDEVKSHVIYIGLRNILMDAHANATAKSGATDAEALEMSTKKLQSMYDGVVRAAGTRTGDPVGKEMRRLANAEVLAALKARGIKSDTVDVVALTNKHLAKSDARLRPIAVANVEATRAVDVDLDI